jgi:hypothetical protein
MALRVLHAVRRMSSDVNKPLRTFPLYGDKQERTRPPVRPSFFPPKNETDDKGGRPAFKEFMKRTPTTQQGKPRPHYKQDYKQDVEDEDDDDEDAEEDDPLESYDMDTFVDMADDIVVDELALELEESRVGENKFALRSKPSRESKLPVMPGTEEDYEEPRIIDEQIVAKVGI